MLNSLTFIPIATLLAQTLASPVDQTSAIDNGARGTKAFTLNEVAVEGAIPRTFSQERARTYMKYGWELPPAIQTSLKYAVIEESQIEPPPGGGETTVPVRAPKGETEFLINVQVGKHNLTLDPDTGSADL